MKASPNLGHAFFISPGIIMAVGIIGNTLVIYVVLRAGQRTVTNYYIVNLAVADVLVLAICSIPTATFYTDIPFVFGQFMCKMVNYTQYVRLYG